MKNWTEGDILHIISTRDTTATSRLCRTLVEQSPPGLFEDKDGLKIKGMIDSMKLGGYPRLTVKQADYAGMMLKQRRNQALMNGLVAALNRMEVAGNAPKFDSIVKADPIVVDLDEARAGADLSVSVSVEKPPLDTSFINSNWGLF